MTNQPDERLVYLALKNVFRGADAQLRKNKKIRDLILRQQDSIDIRNLIEVHNIDNVCNVTKALLEQQIFESTLRAKIRFPEVFEVSQAQSAERSASEQEAARSEADAIQVVAEGLPAPTALFSEDPPIDPITSVKNQHHGVTASIPSLYPVYLPLQTQHKLLVTVQQALEAACYDFAVRHLPDVVTKEGWECAEAVELNLWARTLSRHQAKLPRDSINELGQPLNQLFESVAQLRHTAVHRIRISANRLEQFLVDAESLAKLLHDNVHSLQLSYLRRETHIAVEDIKRHKDLLESQLTAKRRNIAERRIELDQLEQSCIADMVKEDREYQQFATVALSQAIDSPVAVQPNTAVTEQDLESDGAIPERVPKDSTTSSCTGPWEDESSSAERLNSVVS